MAILFTEGMLEMTKTWVFIIFALILAGCGNGPEGQITPQLLKDSSAGSETMYKEKMIELANWIESKRLVHDSGHYYLFDNSLFQDLYTNPYAHFEFGLRLLKDPKVNTNTKALVVRTLQCLGLEDYLVLGNVVVELKNIELSTVYLSPGPEYGIGIDMNYQISSVKELLSEFTKVMPNLKGTIELISTGSNSKRYSELKAFGENIPVLSCNSG